MKNSYFFNTCSKDGVLYMINWHEKIAFLPAETVGIVTLPSQSLISQKYHLNRVLLVFFTILQISLLFFYFS